MDGLAAGLGALISFFLGVVAFQTNQPFLGWVAVAMMGGCLGFLPFNFRIKGNARIFLGDADDPNNGQYGIAGQSNEAKGIRNYPQYYSTADNHHRAYGLGNEFNPGG